MKRTINLLLVAALLFVCAQMGLCADLKDLISGKNIPLTLQMKDLTGTEWRTLTLSNSTASGNIQELMVMGLVYGAGGGAYYTKGQMTSLAGETYIMAYRVQPKALDFAGLTGANRRPLKPEALTPETTLSFSLLNIRTIGSLEDIRPFNLEQELAASAKIAEAFEAPVKGRPETAQRLPQEDLNAASLSNLKQLALALSMYAQDWDAQLPPMDDPATVKEALLPYANSGAIFINPMTKKPYLPNAKFSQRKLIHLPYPAEMVVFYEAQPQPDGSRDASFLDGHAKRVTAAEWERIKKISKIP